MSRLQVLLYRKYSGTNKKKLLILNLCIFNKNEHELVLRVENLLSFQLKHTMYGYLYVLSHFVYFQRL